MWVEQPVWSMYSTAHEYSLQHKKALTLINLYPQIVYKSTGTATSIDLFPI